MVDFFGMCFLCNITNCKTIVPYLLLVVILLLALVCLVLRCTSSVSDEEALLFVAVLTFLFDVCNTFLHLHHLT